MWKKYVTCGEPEFALVERYERFFQSAAPVLDKHLAGGMWISGPDLTLLVISVGATLMYIQPAIPIAGYPNVLALVERVQARDAWKATDLARWA
jgi:glutathione S-transferase